VAYLQGQSGCASANRVCLPYRRSCGSSPISFLEGPALRASAGGVRACEPRFSAGWGDGGPRGRVWADRIDLSYEARRETFDRTAPALLSWTLTEVARDPDAQARLASGEQGLAEAAITETLRLHPPVPLGSLRRLRHPMTIAAWQLPAGATVASCSLLIHRRPDAYEQPTTWRANRFLSTRPPPGAWIPFDGGVRRCVGAAGAHFEASTILDEVTRTLELRPTGRPTRRVGRRGIVLVPPRGGTVIPAPRHPSAPTVATPSRRERILDRIQALLRARAQT
jgi:Cytochrome P450